jgi:mRNA interferase RelE/StbE
MTKPQLYGLRYDLSVLERDIKIIPNNLKKIIQRAIETRLTIDPMGFGKPLRYSLRGHRSLRTGDYRVIFRIDETEKMVSILAIKHRSVVYDT